ncbi:HNH endonuclease signature motif containing protein [Streptomyces sp. NPDC004532]
MARKTPPGERFAALVDTHGPIPLVRGVTGRCHIWRGKPNAKGYGSFHLDGRKVKAHRYAVQLADGAPVPADLDVDHRCRNRACVRRSHLRVVTHRENILASTNHVALLAAKTHCPAGHAYDDANTYRAPNGTRKCRTCKREQARNARVAARTTPTPERQAA